MRQNQHRTFHLFAVVAGVVAFAGLVWAQSGAENDPAKADDAARRPSDKGANSIALVELFTSEGCSSCPPAEKILNELSALEEYRGVTVVSLAYHVSYWDYIGWRDPWASRASTQRQRAYSAAMGRTSVYTPQMVFNGREECVGSNGGDVYARIVSSAIPVVNEDATLLADWRARGRLFATLEVAAAAPADSVYYAAIAANGLTSEVTLGENAGKLLAHERVVLDHRIVLPGAQVEFTEALERAAAATSFDIVAWRQDGVAGPISAVWQTAVPPKK